MYEQKNQENTHTDRFWLIHAKHSAKTAVYVTIGNKEISNTSKGDGGYSLSGHSCHFWGSGRLRRIKLRKYSGGKV